ncbi:MAG: hypothetical protein U1D30_05460 [Planctomycetota bacterium]
MGTKRFQLEAPTGFRLRATVHSHGWYDLPPFRWEDSTRTLIAVGHVDAQPCRWTVRQSRARSVEVETTIAERWNERRSEQAVRIVGHMLGLHHDLRPFFKETGDEFLWAKQLGLGRMLRGASVFEDAVKMMATTNCSWSLTRQMVTRLVDHLGEDAPGGLRAFPTPAVMAKQSTAFYRDAIRAGYRADYFRTFARQVDEGEVDPESWVEFPGTAAELNKAMMRVRGFGRYAAENLSKLLGRHDGLALDSWCLKKYPMVHGPVRGDVQKAIQNHYSRHGRFQGLALWLDLTRDWHEKGIVTSNEKFPPDVG